MVTWADKVAFVGMTVETVPSNITNAIPAVVCYPYHVRVRIPGGACSYGDGYTMEKAIKAAAVGMQMDWHSIEQKITEHEWQCMSHT